MLKNIWDVEGPIPRDDWSREWVVTDGDKKITVYSEEDAEWLARVLNNLGAKDED